MHIPDPEAHVMPDGRVYVYGSWDQHGGTHCSKEYRVVSSHNMVDWVDHGKSFDINQVKWVFDKNAPKYRNVDWDSENPTPFLKKLKEDMARNHDAYKKFEFHGDLLYAPDAIYRNGKYYLYFCTSGGTEGVAVSDKPQGPFVNPVRLPCGGIDPAVFIDDDGQAYYFWGQFRASGVKLKDNMVEFEEGSLLEHILTEEEHGFHEGISVRKRNGIYYCIYSCIKRGKPTALAYATSKSPLGPYEYRGIIIDNDGCDPQTWNNHGSIEEVNGQWYVFYHRSSRNGRTWRRLCIEPIFFNEDGTIPEVPMTSQGAGRPFCVGEKIEAYRACQLSGNVYIDVVDSGYEALTGIKDGDTAIYRYVEWENPVNEVHIEATGSGEIKIYLDNRKQESGRVLIVNGKIVSSSFKGEPGKHEIKLGFNRADDLVIYRLRFDACNR